LPLLLAFLPQRVREEGALQQWARDEDQQQWDGTWVERLLVLPRPRALHLLYLLSRDEDRQPHGGTGAECLLLLPRPRALHLLYLLARDEDQQQRSGSGAGRLLLLPQRRALLSLLTRAQPAEPIPRLPRYAQRTNHDFPFV